MPPDRVSVPGLPATPAFALTDCAGKNQCAAPELMITLPSLSVLNEACQEVLHPWPKIPCVLRVSMADMKVRSMASDMLPGVGSAASIEEASAAAGSAASAWHSRKARR